MGFRSLRSQLLLWLLAPLALVAMLDAWVTYRSARETANIVQDRMLLGAARVIGEQVHLEEGVIQVMIPPAALELFASPARDRVFYRVSTPEGRLLAGYYDLALPPRELAPEESISFASVQRERPVHIVGFAQPVFAAPSRGPILVEVAQTLEGRDELAREFWLAAVRRQSALLLLVALLLWFGLRRGIRPLLRLRDNMIERQPGSLERLDDASAPTELKPLVLAVNDYAQRLDKHMSSHSRFIADASHQLRTPLTLLNTQVVFALRHKESPGRDEALAAIHHSVQHSMRVVQQLLSLTMAEGDSGARHRQAQVDLARTVGGVLESMASIALQRDIDLGFEQSGPEARVQANPQLLHELVSNLVDNALRYTQPGGVVTAGVSTSNAVVTLRIEDNGPGIPHAERQKVFERFYRLHDGVSDGCGLGLAIVREIARSSGARVELGEPVVGSGLVVTVAFPAATSYLAAATNSVV